MCRTVLHKADENFCAGDHEDLKFAAMAMLGGGLDTVSVPMQAINFILTGYSDPKQQSRSSIPQFLHGHGSLSRRSKQSACRT